MPVCHCNWISTLTWHKLKTGTWAFNHLKRIHMWFGPPSAVSVYCLNSSFVQLELFHSDFGIFLSNYLSWSPNLSDFFSKAYRSLGLIRCTLPDNNSICLKGSLYLFLTMSHLSYFSQMWWPHLVHHSRAIKDLPHRATRCIIKLGIGYSLD